MRESCERELKGEGEEGTSFEEELGREERDISLEEEGEEGL